MQSRVAVRLLSGAQNHRPGRFLATTTGRTADPATHAVEPEEVDANEGIKDEKQRHLTQNEPSSTKYDESYVPPKSPIESVPKLENTPVGPRTDPLAHQKRRVSSNAAPMPIEEVICTGIDGGPWPGEEQSREADRKEQADDNREYFEHHKASPLSEIEMADTRKPITRATDGTVQSDKFGYDVSGVILWRPEQLESAEETLLRASEMFTQNAMRGDPDSPHGRVLRQLRHEYW